MQRFFNWFNNLYPVWLVSLAIVAFFKPQTMLWFDKPWILWSLAASMLGMGLTLGLDDFRRIGKMPGCVALGFASQYTIMPLCGWFVGWLLKLEPGLAVGIILVASCPGGMASNMISYLARANVALSVILTLCSTVMSFVFTPLWTGWLAGTYVPVDKWGLCLSALQLVVAPVMLGVLIRWKLPRTADKIGACGPTVAVIAFTLVTGVLDRDPIAQGSSASMVNGAVNAFVIILMRVPPFIATLATMLAAKGGALVLSGAQTISVDWGSNFTKLGMEKAFGVVPWTIVLVAIVALAAWFVLERTSLGRTVLAIGGGEDASVLMGLEVDRTKAFVYMLSGACAGIAVSLANLGCPAEFGGHHHQGFIEQAPLFEVGDEPCEGLIKRRHLVAETADDVVVHVPAAVGQIDQTATRFDKTSCENHTCPRLIATVLVSQFGIFLLDVEGIPSLG